MYEELYHHGIKGQRWGVRRFQNYNTTLNAAGNRFKRSIYTNLDGSLNELYHAHLKKYVERNLKKNEKYYDKWIKKYQKKIEQNKDDKQLVKQYKDFIESAKKTKVQVSDYIKNMNFDEMRDNENVAMKKAATAGLAVAGIGTIALSGRGVYKLANTDPNELQSTMQKWVNSPEGKRLIEYADSGIRAYADVNAFVAGTYVDQTLSRLNERGTINRVSETVSNATKGTTKPIVNEYAHLLDQVRQKTVDAKSR